jgi:putative PIN family toxin of toxin-antitoxin system
VRVFLDTNVLVSAVTTRGLAVDVLRVVLTEHTLVTGEVVLAELRRVLARRFGVPKTAVEEFDALLRQHEVVAKPVRAVDLAVRDPDDRWIVASAVAAEADVLVTGDHDLLSVRRESPVPITDPRGFWELLRRGA